MVLVTNLGIGANRGGKEMSYLPSVQVLQDRPGREVLLVPRALGRVRSYRLAMVLLSELMESFRQRRAIGRSKTISQGRKMPMVDRSRTKGRSMLEQGLCSAQR